MAKDKTQFVCSECGYVTGRWRGQCGGCNEWNTLVEEVVQPEIKTRTARKMAPSKATKVYQFSDIPEESQQRYSTQIDEFDRVLGGGVVPGAVVLSGGEPGIGKSTLLLQVADKLTKNGKVLYVSGEESAAQIKMRAVRLGISDGLFIAAENELASIMAAVEEIQPDFLVVDSIQTLYDATLTSAPGSVAQVRGCATRLTTMAKSMGIATFIIGHVTKDGAIAGPRVLEHIVDTVLYFEGEQTSNFRILRAVKNRFGSTDEIGIFEMRDVGMVPVDSSAVLMYEGDQPDLNGVCLFAATQGTRPMLLEVQALCSHTQMKIPRRMCSGFDTNRLYMIAAVLEKKIGLKLYNQDIFVNVAGGIKIKEHAADLALAVAIVSSLRNRSVGRDTAFIGEVGLAGEIRNVTQISKRVSECERLGVKRVFIPRHGSLGSQPKRMELIKVDTLFQVLDRVF